MEKLDIIKIIENRLPTEYHNATITVQNEEMPLFSFLENIFPRFFKEDANPDNLIDYIKNNENISRLIKFDKPNIQKGDEFYTQKVDEYIASNPYFKDIIQTGPREEDIISVRNHLIEYAQKFMDENGELDYIGKKISFDDLYIKLLNNEYRMPTIEEKAELCIDMTRYIDLAILDSIVDGMDITVRDYICTVLPTKMISATEVELNSEVFDLDEFVTRIVNHQAKMIETEKAKKQQELEDIYNKTGDNPGLVSEIQVRLKGDNNLEITAEIPVVTSSLVSEEEKTSLLSNYREKEVVTDEEYYTRELNSVKLAIEKTTTSHDLNSKEKFFKTIAEEALSKELSSQIKVLIESIDELITLKRNNIIKITNNQEEYVDVLFSEINTMTTELNGFTSLDEYSNIYGKALERYQDVLEKGISDIQLRSAFQILFNRINEKRLNLDATIGYQSPEVERCKVELNALMSDIMQDLLTIEHDSNNLGNLTGTEIRLNSNIETAKEKVEKAYIDKLLTEDDREYYMNRLKGYSMAIQSETKIGYGLR